MQMKKMHSKLVNLKGKFLDLQACISALEFGDIVNGEKVCYLYNGLGR